MFHGTSRPQAKTRGSGPKALRGAALERLDRQNRLPQHYPLYSRRADEVSRTRYICVTFSNEVETQMPPELDLDLIGALTGFSVGTLDGRDAMMVIEIAANAEDFAHGIRHKMPVAMTPERARELGEALLMAAAAAIMGDAPSYAVN